MNSHTSSGDVQTISMASSKPESCKLAHGSPCAPCLELEIFDREAQSILERLSEDRRKILAQINRHHDPFIQRLPLELASQIFAFCLPLRDPDTDPCYNPLFWSRSKGRYIKPFNIVLGAICRAWRQVAWSTPKLWSTLPISLHRCDNRAYKELVSEWLMRSAQIPLDVSLWNKGLAESLPLTEKYVNIWKPLIDIVNGCSSRWRSFSIYAPDLVLAYIIGDSRGTSRLEYLKVDPGPWVLEPPSYADERSLHRFSLTNAIPMPSELVSIPMPLRSIDIDWSSLITIEIGKLYLNESLVLLRWTPRLTRCKLNDLQGGQDENLPSPTPTHHHTLQELDIRDQLGQQIAEQLLGFLILPSLISLLYDSEYNSLENVAAFLDRSGCRLTTLHDAHGVFHKLLVLAPHLQALEWLQYPGYIGRGKYPPNQWLPNLCEILLHSGPVFWDLVFDLIMSCPPKAFTIHVEDLESRDEDFLIDEESARRFQDLIEKGYDIKISDVRARLGLKAVA